MTFRKKLLSFHYFCSKKVLYVQVFQFINRVLSSGRRREKYQLLWNQFVNKLCTGNFLFLSAQKGSIYPQ